MGLDGQSLQQPRPATRSGFLQGAVPVLEHGSQLMLQLAQLTHMTFEILELDSRQFSHSRAWKTAAVADCQDLSEFTEGETDGKRRPDQADSVHRLRRVG